VRPAAVPLAPFPFSFMVGLALLGTAALGVAAATVGGSLGGVVRGQADALVTDAFAAAPAAGGPPVPAAAYVVLDAGDDRPLAAVDADERRPVGSLTKLMTAHLALDAGDPDHEVIVPPLDLAGDESQVGLEPGTVETRATLIRAALVASANDAADALAVDLGGDEASFVDRMNAEAERLGLDGTHYANAEGMDARGQFSTAGDVATLADELMDDAAFRGVVDDPSVTVDGVTHATTNDLLGTYPGAEGVKTGHTDDAGWCLAASAVRDGRRVIVVVLGAPTEEARNASATTLLDWAFSTGSTPVAGG
jgi:D-alanyl-D-alanine carboxypeptidase (penicillin-binding protein 5/6)